MPQSVDCLSLTVLLLVAGSVVCPSVPPTVNSYQPRPTPTEVPQQEDKVPPHQHKVPPIQPEVSPQGGEQQQVVPPVQPEVPPQQGKVPPQQHEVPHEHEAEQYDEGPCIEPHQHDGPHQHDAVNCKFVKTKAAHAEKVQGVEIQKVVNVSPSDVAIDSSTVGALEAISDVTINGKNDVIKNGNVVDVVAETVTKAVEVNVQQDVDGQEKAVDKSQVLQQEENKTEKQQQTKSLKATAQQEQQTPEVLTGANTTNVTLNIATVGKVVTEQKNTKIEEAVNTEGQKVDKPKDEERQTVEQQTQTQQDVTSSLNNARLVKLSGTDKTVDGKVDKQSQQVAEDRKMEKTGTEKAMNTDKPIPDSGREKINEAKDITDGGRDGGLLLQTMLDSLNPQADVSATKEERREKLNDFDGKVVQDESPLAHQLPRDEASKDDQGSRKSTVTTPRHIVETGYSYVSSLIEQLKHFKSRYFDEFITVRGYTNTSDVDRRRSLGNDL
jgi:hypothetical protein